MNRNKAKQKIIVKMKKQTLTEMHTNRKCHSQSILVMGKWNTIYEKNGWILYLKKLVENFKLVAKRFANSFQPLTYKNESIYLEIMTKQWQLLWPIWIQYIRRFGREIFDWRWVFLFFWFYSSSHCFHVHRMFECIQKERNVSVFFFFLLQFMSNISTFYTICAIHANKNKHSKRFHFLMFNQIKSKQKMLNIIE